MRKLLLWFLVAGLAGASNPGTFASFSAATTNAGDFAAGTLILENTKRNQTACLSTGGGAADVNDGDCDAMFTILVSKGGAQTARMTVANVGSLDASSLQLHWTGGAPCVTVDEPAEAFHGTGDLCGVLRLQVQEYASQVLEGAADETGGTCWYGGGTATACAYNNNRDLADFSATYPGTGGNVIDMGPFAAGQTRWFRLLLQGQAGQLTNAHQGRRVDFGFTWALVQ